MLSSRGKTIWLFFPPLLALAVSLLPDVSWQTILITQVVALPLSFFLLLSDGGIASTRKAIAATATLGLACALYLAYNWYAGGVAQCSSDGCAIAQSSSYARLFFDIPTSTVGVLGYCLVLLSLLYNRLPGYTITAFLAAFGFATSVYLTYSSVFVLETTCQWCLGSATAMSAIALLSYWLFVRGIEARSE